MKETAPSDENASRFKGKSLWHKKNCAINRLVKKERISHRDQQHIRPLLRLALVGYIKLFIICISLIILDISPLSFILIVNVWLVYKRIFLL